MISKVWKNKNDKYYYVNNQGIFSVYVDNFSDEFKTSYPGPKGKSYWLMDIEPQLTPTGIIVFKQVNASYTEKKRAQCGDCKPVRELIKARVTCKGIEDYKPHIRWDKFLPTLKWYNKDTGEEIVDIIHFIRYDMGYRFGDWLDDDRAIEFIKEYIKGE